MKKPFLALLFISSFLPAFSQLPVDLQQFNPRNGATAAVLQDYLDLSWPAGGNQRGQLRLSLQQNTPLISNIGIRSGNTYREAGAGLDPAFILTVGKRDLVSQNGWNIFFDKVPLKPHQSYRVQFTWKAAQVVSTGSRTVVRIGELSAGQFSGVLEITLYNGSPLLNIAAVMHTEVDSVAMVYDAGLVSRSVPWKQIAWSDTNNHLQQTVVHPADTATHQAVKYRTIIAGNQFVSLAVFPAPHQYFYPLDEAFNLRFTWWGSGYRNMIPEYGIGIRQELEGDNRYVPWFNAPPGTDQRLSFFCLPGAGNAASALAQVKRFTNSDTYQKLPGHKTFASHFHNEFVMNVMLAGKPVPDTPGFLRVFKQSGVDIVHLAEFHYTAHPKGPDDQRLLELSTLFAMCKKFSDSRFLLLPGEEPNEFFGGHWLDFFPRPVYWIMSRKPGTPFVATDPRYGKVYHIGDKHDMLRLLEQENGLAWTAHPRTKGSTGFPDAYRQDSFFLSPHFLGAAWKAMPADLSQPRLGKRVLDLMDDMNNWGARKQVLSEADLFTIEPQNEMWAHMNINYLRLTKLPVYTGSWQPILDALRKGQFFSTTGEVLIPRFTVNGKESGETVHPSASGNVQIRLSLSWTLPLQFVEIISGDGTRVYRKRIPLESTLAFGKQTFSLSENMKGRKWVRVEVWDVAADGAFTQTVWLD